MLTTAPLFMISRLARSRAEFNFMGDDFDVYFIKAS